MTIEFLPAPLRLALWMAIPLLGLAALWLRYRTRYARAVAICFIAALTSLFIVGLDAILVLVFRGESGQDFNEYSWRLGSPWSLPVHVVGVALAVASILLCIRNSARADTHIKRIGIIACRVGATAGALILFFQPTLELQQVARQPNRIAILVDRSASMNLRAGREQPSRSQLAKTILEQSSQTFESWEQSREIDYWAFADTLETTSLAALSALPANGGQTNLRTALQRLREHYRDNELAAVVLLSDGTATGPFSSGADDKTSVALLRSLGVPVHSIWTAESKLYDVSVARIRSDEFAFVRTATKLNAKIRSTGYKRRRIPVTLSQNGTPIRRKWIQVGGKTKSVDVSFEFTPMRLGKEVYTISTPVHSDEAVADNNRSAFVVRVVRDKTRVLQIAGRPSWDVKTLRSYFKDATNVDLISFFILRGYFQTPRVPRDQLALIRFPTRELFQQQLPSFDVVFFQNFDNPPFDAPQTVGRYLENIRQYVADGGGFVMLGGELAFSSGGYADTPLADLLPVTLSKPVNRDDPDLLDLRPFRPRLTQAGDRHPVTAFAWNTTNNRNIWKRLPALEGANIVARVKPEATVLAYHPTARTLTGQRLPIVTAMDYGKGRVLSIATDTLWHWRRPSETSSGAADRYFAFWSNALRWLTHDPSLNRLRIDTDAVKYRVGEQADITIKLYNEDYSDAAGTQITVEVVRDAGGASGVAGNDEATRKFELPLDEQGTTTRRIEIRSQGTYRIHATAKVAGKTITATDVFFADATDSEYTFPEPRNDVLRAAAEATGARALGRVRTIPPDLRLNEPEIVRVDAQSELPLWSHGLWLFLTIGLLTGEWLLRHRSGYL